MAFAAGGNFTDGSGSIATGGTAQTQLPQNTGRIYILIQNIDAAANLFVNFGVTAVADQPSIRLVPGAALEFSAAGTGFVPTGLVSVIGPTNGQKFVIKAA